MKKSKKTVSKKLLALLMAVVLFATTFSALGLTASAAETKDKYLFAYFTGDTQKGQHVRFAVSEDGYHYDVLNGGEPIITQTLGTQCCRDPYMFQGQDGAYYVICTDMDATMGWWDHNNSMIIWKSTDLVNWTNETLINMEQMMGIPLKACWAPQVIWDAASGKYMVYFSIAADSIAGYTHYIYYCLTDDLLNQSHYSAPQILFKPANNGSAIDGDIWYNNGTYYLYYKDEVNKTICYTTSSKLTGPYNTTGTKILNVDVDLEGGNCFINAQNGKLVMMADAYGNGYFVMAESTDYENFTLLNNSDYKINHLSPRHGSVINITTAQYNALIESYSTSGIGIEDNYYFTNPYSESGTAWHIPGISDPSGNSITVMDWGSVHIADGYATLGGNKVMFIEGDTIRSIMKGNQFAITFSFELNDTDDQAYSTIAAVMEANANIDHILLRKDGAFLVDGAEVGRTTIEQGKENVFTISNTGSKVSLYKNGELVASANKALALDQLANPLTFSLGWTDASAGNGFTNGKFGNIKATSASLEAYTLDELKAAMAKFEAKMQSGKVYANMDNAYTAYVACQKAYDAYYYGADESISLAEPAISLLYAIDHMTEWTPATAKPTSLPSYSTSSVDSNRYSNVLWGSNCSGDVNMSNGSSHYAKVNTRVWARYPEVVFLYTDGAVLTAPIMLSVNGNSEKNDGGSSTNAHRYVHAIVADGNNDVTYTEMWHHSKQDPTTWQYEDLMNGKDGISSPTWLISRETTKESGAVDNVQVRKKGTTSLGVKAYTVDFATVMQMNTSLLGTSYSRDYTPTTHIYLSDGTGFTTSNAASTDTITWSATLHVINYQLLLDKVNAYNGSSALKNVADYSEGGLSTMMTALGNAAAFDPNSYFVSGNGYDACKTNLQTAVENFNNLTNVENSVSYQNLRNAIDRYDNIKNEPCFSSTYWNTFTATLASCRQAMAKVYNAGYTDSNATINALVSGIDGAYENLTSEQYMTHQYLKYAFDSNGTATFKCNANMNHTHEVTADVSTYNALETIYKTLDFNTYADNGAAIKAAKELFDAMKTTPVLNDKNSSYPGGEQQKLVDSCITKLRTAMNTALEDQNVNDYNVTFIVDVDGVQTVVKNNEPHKYGDVVSLDATDVEGVTWTYKWTVESQGSTQTVTNYSGQYAVRIQSDTTVIAYAATKNEPAEGMVAVTIHNQIANPLYNVTVPADTSLTLDAANKTVTIGGTAYKLETIAFRNVDAFRIGGTNYANVYNTTVGAAAKNSRLDIFTASNVADTSYQITLNGVTVNPGAKDDEEVTVSASGAYAIAIEQNGVYSVASYTDSYTFFANRPMNFYSVQLVDDSYVINGRTVTDDVMVHSLNNKLPFSYSAGKYDAQEGILYTFSAYSVLPADSNVKIVECGTLYTLKGYDAENFVLGASGVYAKASKSQTDVSNQYYLGITDPPAGYTLTTRGYVKYTYTYNGSKIEAIAYGDICSK